MGGDTHEKKRKNPSPPGFLVGCMVSVAHVCVGCTCKLLAARGYIHLLCTNVLIENCCLHMCKVAKWCLHICVIAIYCSHMIACTIVVHEGNNYKLAFADVNGCKLLFHMCVIANCCMFKVVCKSMFTHELTTKLCLHMYVVAWR